MTTHTTPTFTWQTLCNRHLCRCILTRFSTTNTITPTSAQRISAVSMEEIFRRQSTQRRHMVPPPGQGNRPTISTTTSMITTGNCWRKRSACQTTCATTPTSTCYGHLGVVTPPTSTLGCICRRLSPSSTINISTSCNSISINNRCTFNRPNAPTAPLPPLPLPPLPPLLLLLTGLL